MAETLVGRSDLLDTGQVSFYDNRGRWNQKKRSESMEVKANGLLLTAKPSGMPTAGDKNALLSKREKC